MSSKIQIINEIYSNSCSSTNTKENHRRAFYHKLPTRQTDGRTDGQSNECMKKCSEEKGLQPNKKALPTISYSTPTQLVPLAYT